MSTSTESTSERTMTPRAARALLPRLASRIERLDAETQAAFAQRLQAIHVLSEAGMTQAEIGALANVTPMAIAQQLHKARKANGRDAG